MGEIETRQKSSTRNWLLVILALAGWYVAIKRTAFPTFQEASDVLVYQAINAAHGGTFPTRWLGLVGPADTPYSSQFGLQGFVFALPANIGIPPGKPYLITIWLLSALLFAAIATAFARSASSLFSGGAGKWVVGLLFISPWLILMADSPYWMVGLMIWPFVFAWAHYQQWAMAGTGRTWFLLGVTFLVMLKSLCGYEYITNVLLSVLVPITYFEYLYGGGWKRILVNGFMAVVAGGIGFLLAVGIHASELKWNTGSWENAREAIVDRAVARGTFSKYAKSDGGILIPSDAHWTDAIKSYFGAGRPRVEINQAELTEQKNFVYTDPNVGKFSKASGFINLLMFLVTIASIVAGWLTSKRLKSNGDTASAAKLKALACATIVAIPISFSWSVAAFRHMYYHWHLNYITFYVPMYLTAYALLGAWWTLRKPRPAETAPEDNA